MGKFGTYDEAPTLAGTEELLLKDGAATTRVSIDRVIAERGTAAQVTYDDTGNTSFTGDDVQEALDAADAALVNTASVGTGLIMAGVIGGIPAAATAGRLYYATDTQTLYRDSGSEWVQVAPKVTSDLTVTKAGRVWNPATAATKSWKSVVPGATTSVVSAGFGTSAGTTGTVSTPAATAAGNWTQFLSAASIGAGADERFTANPWFRGAATDNLAGFFYFARARWTDASYNETGASTGSRINVGMSGTAPITSRRGGSIHCALFNREHENGQNTDTNWNFCHNDGGATGTTVNTGMPFATTDEFEFWIWCPAGATALNWQIDNVTAGTSASGTTAAATDLPGATTAIYPGIWLYTVDAVARSFQANRLYIESDRG
jgi:hypothetical protein